MRSWLWPALLASALFTFAPAAAQAASSGGELTTACRGISELLRGPCRGAEQLVSAVSATCRSTRLVGDEPCTLPLAPRVSAAAVNAYGRSWAHRAHRLQYELAGDVALRDAPWVGTHNSFNSVAEMGPTLSDLDANQQLALTDQLRLDVRSLELDLHWFPSLAALGARAPVVCHALGADQAHAGCSIEKTLDPVLAEIRGWLRRNGDQVLLLYLEDDLENAQGHAAGAAAVRRRLGDLLYAPPSGGATCDELPLELTRDAIRAAGKQVLIVSGCGVGRAWRGIAFDWSSHVEARPRGFEDFPSCGPQFDRPTYESTLVRFYEDTTAVTATSESLGGQPPDDGITPSTAARMARCGVDLTGMDQLLPDDGRLEALVWSWARGEPSAAGDCSVQRANGRWAARPCSELHPVACRTAGGGWSVTGPAVPAAAAPAHCGAAVHAVPRTGFENELLRAAAAGGEPWLGQRRDGDGWTALDPR